MPKTLAELQQSPDVGLPERRASICLAARLVDELEPIQEEFVALQVEIENLEAQDDPAPAKGGQRRRAGQKSTLGEKKKRARELAETGDAIRERIEDNSVQVLLRAITSGDWRQWVSKHPARSKDDDPQGYAMDLRWAMGACNIDDLIADLAKFVVTYNDEPATDAWAAFVAENGAPAHLRLAASKVVGMHEQVVDAGKSLTAWLDGRSSGATSN